MKYRVLAENVDRMFKSEKMAYRFARLMSIHTGEQVDIYREDYDSWEHHAAVRVIRAA